MPSPFGPNQICSETKAARAVNANVSVSVDMDGHGLLVCRQKAGSRRGMQGLNSWAHISQFYFEHKRSWTLMDPAQTTLDARATFKTPYARTHDGCLLIAISATASLTLATNTSWADYLGKGGLLRNSLVGGQIPGLPWSNLLWTGLPLYSCPLAEATRRYKPRQQSTSHVPCTAKLPRNLAGHLPLLNR